MDVHDDLLHRLGIGEERNVNFVMVVLLTTFAKFVNILKKVFLMLNCASIAKLVIMLSFRTFVTNVVMRVSEITGGM